MSDLMTQITGQKMSAKGGQQPYLGNPDTQYWNGMTSEKGIADQYGANEGADRSAMISTLDGGQHALEASTQAAMSSAMPSLFQALQGTRETNLRRGMVNGETPTSYEGDVISAFQRNIANATAGQSMNMYNTQVSGRENLLANSSNQSNNARSNYYDLVSGKLDRDQAKKNAKSSMWGNVIKGATELGTAAILA